MKRINGIVIGGIVMLATVLIFFLTASSQSLFSVGMAWMGFSVVLIFELITTALFATSNAEPRKVGAAMAVLLETVLLIPLSIIFTNLFPLAYTTYILIFIVLTAVVAIIAFIILRSDSAVKAKDAARNQSKQKMLNCRAVVNGIINSAEGKQYEAILRGLDEDLRFADDTVTCEIDDNIYVLLCELMSGVKTEGYDVETKVSTIKDMLKQREFLAKNRIR